MNHFLFSAAVITVGLIVPAHAQASTFVCKSRSGETMSVQRSSSRASFSVKADDGTAFRCVLKQTQATIHDGSSHYRYYWQMPEELAKSTCENNGGRWETSTGGCETY